MNAWIEYVVIIIKQTIEDTVGMDKISSPQLEDVWWDDTTVIEATILVQIVSELKALSLSSPRYLLISNRLVRIHEMAESNKGRHEAKFVCVHRCNSAPIRDVLLAKRADSSLV